MGMDASTAPSSSSRWLPAVILLVLGVVYIGFSLESWQLKTYPDTDSYLVFGQQSFAEVLAHSRTMGYPILAYLLKGVTGTYDAMPLLHAILHVMATVLFWYGLKSYGLRPWSAFVVTLPVLFANMIRYFTHALLTDALGLSLVVWVMGLLLLALAHPKRRLYWVGLGIMVFVAFQVRPANQVLVPALVLIGGLLYLIRYGRQRSETAPGFWPVMGRLTATGFIPLLGFFTLRLLVVGHFGLVSATGIPLMGIAGSLITQDLVPQLSEEVQPLAQTLVDNRKKTQYEVPFSTLGWIRYGEWYRQYDWNNFNSGVMQHALRMNNGNWVKMDRAMQKLAIEVFKLRFSLYTKWLMAASGDALGVLLRRDFNMQVTALMWLLAAMVYHAGRAIWVRQYNRIPPVRSTQAVWESSVIFTLSMLYLGMSTLLIILSAPPIERYLYNSAAFLPGLLALLAFLKLEDVWRMWGAKKISADG
ncbi:hypothetical protein [Magnetococcus sp. PR-3]|uniref:hypothetical protein n=1 Tax=Magnetococcus sp. PR-3 TaxID=3120355 RepID=UPI002FCE2F0A